MFSKKDIAREKLVLLRIYIGASIVSLLSIVGWYFANFDSLFSSMSILTAGEKTVIFFIGFAAILGAHAVLIVLYTKILQGK